MSTFGSRGNYACGLHVKNEKQDDAWRLKQEDANCKTFWVKFLATALDHIFNRTLAHRRLEQEPYKP